MSEKELVKEMQAQIKMLVGQVEVLADQVEDLSQRVDETSEQEQALVDQAIEHDAAIQVIGQAINALIQTMEPAQLASFSSTLRYWLNDLEFKQVPLELRLPAALMQSFLSDVETSEAVSRMLKAPENRVRPRLHVVRPVLSDLVNIEDDPDPVSPAS